MNDLQQYAISINFSLARDMSCGGDSTYRCLELVCS